jgi:hypothetical protein
LHFTHQVAEAAERPALLIANPVRRNAAFPLEKKTLAFGVAANQVIQLHVNFHGPASYYRP